MALANKQAKSEGLIVNGEVLPEHLSRYLHLVKEGFDKMLSRTGNEALDRTAKRTTRQLSKELIRWLGAKNPDYEAARANYASLSRPVNRAQVGSELGRALDQPVSEAADRASVFANALKNAPQTIKKATGDARYDDLGQILTPKEVSGIDDVLRALKLDKTFTEKASMGAPTARAVIEDTVPDLRLPGVLERTVVIFNSLLGRGKGVANQVTKEALADLMQPGRNQELADLIEEAMQGANGGEVRELLAGIQAARLASQAPALTTGTKDG